MDGQVSLELGVSRLQGEWAALYPETVVPVDAEQLMRRHGWLIERTSDLGAYQMAALLAPGSGIRRALFNERLTRGEVRQLAAYLLLRELRGEAGAVRMRWPLTSGRGLIPSSHRRAVAQLLVPPTTWDARSLLDLAHACDVPLDLAVAAVRWMPEDVQARFMADWPTIRFEEG